MGNEQSNDARDELDIDAIDNEEVMTKEQLRGIQSLFKQVIKTYCFNKVFFIKKVNI